MNSNYRIAQGLGPDAYTRFKRHFGYPPVHVVRAPGTLELLGGQTEPHQGLAISAAVSQFVEVAAAPRTDGRIELLSTATPERATFWLTDLAQRPTLPWVNPAMAVLEELRKRRVHFSGFSAAIHEGIAPGFELGGAAALAVAVTLTVRRLFPFSLGETGATLPPRRDASGDLPPIHAFEKLRFAALCQAALGRHAKDAGLLGPLTSLFGKPWHLLSIDFQTRAIERWPLVGEALVLCRPERAAAPGAEPTVAALRRLGESAAQKLGVKSLRALEPKVLQAARPRLTPAEFACARHLLDEIRRTIAADRTLQADDHVQFGQFLRQSYQSRVALAKKPAPDLALLAALALAHKGCLGVRQSGGAVVNLVAWHQAENFMECMTRLGQKRLGVPVHTQLCQMVEGAG